jgi:mono/diheme cytochrome c family protein
VGNGYISAMPGFSEILSDREIWSSLAYIKSRWPLRIRAAQANSNH